MKGLASSQKYALMHADKDLMGLISLKPKQLHSFCYGKKYYYLQTDKLILSKFSK